MTPKLTIGNRVFDKFGDEGIVVKIVKGTSQDDHGTVYVWQEYRINYGADNCEHYPEWEWWKILSVLDQ